MFRNRILKFYAIGICSLPDKTLRVFHNGAGIQKKKLHLQITLFTQKHIFQMIYCIILQFLAHCAMMLVLEGKRPFFWMSRSHVDYSQRWWPQDNLDLPTIFRYMKNRVKNDFLKFPQFHFLNKKYSKYYVFVSHEF